MEFGDPSQPAQIMQWHPVTGKDDAIDEQVDQETEEDAYDEINGSFELLYRQHFRPIVNVIRSRVSDPDEAEDLGMTVFELAWERHQSGEPVRLAWLYQCVRNVVGNEYQRRNRNVRLQMRLVSNFEAKALVTPEDRNLELARVMRRLSAVDRKLLTLVYWYGYSLHDVADILGASEPAIKMRMSRLRRKIRVYLTSAHHTDGRTHACEDL